MADEDARRRLRVIADGDRAAEHGRRSQYVDVSCVIESRHRTDDIDVDSGDALSTAEAARSAPSDVLYRDGAADVARTAIVPESLDGESLHQRTFIALRPDDRSSIARFLFYCSDDALRWPIVDDCDGRDGAHASSEADARALPIPVPPLAEQQRIVGILDEAFEGIAIAKANAEKNLQNARALFESHLQSVFAQRGEGWVETTLERCRERSQYGSQHVQERAAD